MAQTKSNPPASEEGKLAEGVLELCGKDTAFLRNLKRHLVPRSDDPSVSSDEIRKLGLRGGELLAGPVEAAPRGPSLRQLSRVESINGVTRKGCRPRHCTRPPPSTRTIRCTSTR
ncbi:MAG: hypothetical protein ACE5I3_14405 [Phycisphaerae bacterium]